MKPFRIFLLTLFIGPALLNMAYGDEFNNLIRAVIKGDDSIRVEAIKSLGERGDKRAIEPLVSILQDVNEKAMIRGEAACSLGNILSKDRIWAREMAKTLHEAIGVREKEQENVFVDVERRALEILVNSLMDNNTYVQENVINALDSIGWDKVLPFRSNVVEPLILLLNNEDKYSEKAAEALGILKDKRAVKPLIAALKSERLIDKKYMVWALGEIGDNEGVEPLIAAIGNYELRLLIIEALGKIKDKRAINFLVVALENYDKSARASAARALGELGDKTVINHLIRTFNSDKEQVVRVWAAYGLFKLGDVDKIDFLISTSLNISSNDVRSAAILALAETMDDKAVETLITLLVNSNLDYLAKNALLKIGKYKIEALIAALNNKDLATRREILKLLKKLDWKPIDDQEKVQFLLSGGNFDAVGKLGEKAVDLLIVYLRDSDPWIREKAAMALGETREIKAIIPLIAVLRDADADKSEKWFEYYGIREAAAVALGKIGDKRATNDLIAVLNDKNESLRSKSAEALGKIGDTIAIEPLIELLIREDEKRVKYYIKKSLGEIGEPAVKSLLVNLKKVSLELEKDFEILLYTGKTSSTFEYNFGNQNNIIAALANVGHPAVEPLILALDDKCYEYKEAIIRTLGDIGDKRAVKPLIELLRKKGWFTDKTRAIRSEAAYALGKIKDVKAIDPLIKALNDKDEDVRENAARSLGMIGDKKAIEPLKIVIEIDQNRSVQKAAQKALEKIAKGNSDKDRIIG